MNFLQFKLLLQKLKTVVLIYTTSANANTCAHCLGFFISDSLFNFSSKNHTYQTSYQLW